MSGEFFTSRTYFTNIFLYILKYFIQTDYSSNPGITAVQSKLQLALKFTSASCRWVLIQTDTSVLHQQQAGGRGSSVRCASNADGRGFDLHFRQHSFVDIGHEIIFTVILSPPLIQEGQSSECAQSTGKLPRRLVQEQCQQCG